MEIKRIIKIKGTHCWVETEEGIFRKPTISIPDNFIKDYENEKSNLPLLQKRVFSRQRK